MRIYEVEDLHGIPVYACDNMHRRPVVRRCRSCAGGLRNLDPWRRSPIGPDPGDGRRRPDLVGGIDLHGAESRMIVNQGIWRDHAVRRRQGRPGLPTIRSCHAYANCRFRPRRRRLRSTSKWRRSLMTATLLTTSRERRHECVLGTRTLDNGWLRFTGITIPGVDRSPWRTSRSWSTRRPESLSRLRGGCHNPAAQRTGATCREPRRPLCRLGREPGDGWQLGTIPLPGRHHPGACRFIRL